MLSNNSIVAVFSKEPITNHNGKEFCYRCNITQSYARKDADGNYMTDENGKRIYVKDFSGYVKFLGDAYTFMKGKDIPENRPLRIRVDNMGVKTYSVNKEVNGETKKQFFTDVLVFKASDLEDTAPAPTAQDDDEELPLTN